MLLESAQGAGIILRNQQFGNDGVGDQITLGSQMPAAIVIDIGVTQLGVLTQHLLQIY